MGRISHHLNNVLNAVFILAAAALVVLGLISLFGGPTLAYAPYMIAVCAVYYLASSVKVFAGGGRRSALKGSLLLLLVLLLAAFAFVTYRSLA